MGYVLKIGTSTSNLVDMPAASTFDIEYEDQSAKDANRTEGGKMYKKRLGTVRKASFSWKNLSLTQASNLFKAVQKEYVYAQFLDPYQGGSVTAEFYVGNRKATYHESDVGVWSNISFSLTERNFAGGLT